jgi:hypothetical protein
MKLCGLRRAGRKKIQQKESAKERMRKGKTSMNEKYEEKGDDEGMIA